MLENIVYGFDIDSLCKSILKNCTNFNKVKDWHNKIRSSIIENFYD